MTAIWDSTPPTQPLDDNPTSNNILGDCGALESPIGSSLNIAAPGNCEVRLRRLTKLLSMVVQQLEKEDCTFAQWLALIFDDKCGREMKDLRYKHFWQHPDTVASLLKSWTSSRQTASGRNLVVNWARAHVAKEMNNEAKNITSSRVLQSSSLEIGPEYLESFKIRDIQDKIQEQCSTSIHMLLSLSGVDLSITTLAAAPESVQNVITYSLSAMLREHNIRNNIIQVVLSLYMYAAGLQRQAFAVLSHVGLLVSYTLLVTGLGTSGQRTHQIPSTQEPNAPVEDVATPTKKEPKVGPLKNLSDGCVKRLQHLARPESNTEIGYIFDNINMVRKVADQVVGRNDTQMNGTCAMVFEVNGATPEALDQKKAMDSFLSAPPLTPNDILLTAPEHELHRELMVHNLLSIIVEHGGTHFGQYKSLLEKHQPWTSDRLQVYQSKVYSMPAMEIEESSVDGVIDVMTEIYSTLKIDTTTEDFQNKVHFVGGDQKSIAHLRAAKDSRAGNDVPSDSFANVVPLIGLFHMLMAAITGFLVIHFGKPGANIHNPGSLSYHNTVLERKPFTLTSLPPVSVSRSLINVSLIARVLHCLTLVSGCSLEEYVQTLIALDLGHKDLEQSWAQLVSDASTLFDKYASGQAVHDLRVTREVASPGEAAGDMVYENALLYLRDGLNIREFIGATKRGDPGAVVLILKVFALSFRGSGRVKYAFEAISLIHHLQKVWPKPLRDLALKNWLLNPTGKPNAWVPLDLVQEHANFWIKAVYSATGSNASWSWLAVISPCTEALRNLVRDLNGTIGTYLGTKHTTPDISLDVAKLIRSLEAHNVYRICPGRTLDDEDVPVIDAEVVGLQKLIDGRESSLEEYNQLFESLQKVHRQPNVSRMPSQASLARQPPVSSNQINGGLHQEGADAMGAGEVDPNSEGEESEEDVEDQGGGEDVGGESDPEYESDGSLTRETAKDCQLDDYSDDWQGYDDISTVDG